MTSTLSSFLYDSAKGTFTIVDTLSTLPTDYKMPGNSTAEVAVHPNGKFVYVSNRGHNSIAIFGVEGTLAKLTALGHVPTGGKVPRNFGIDPTGTFLLAANQDSDNVVAYRINANTGLPTATGSEVSVPKPVCVKFVK
jgi:6-phosphogluconolactonase